MHHYTRAYARVICINIYHSVMVTVVYAIKPELNYGILPERMPLRRFSVLPSLPPAPAPNVNKHIYIYI